MPLSVVLGHAVEDGEDLVEGGGVDHGDAELLEVAESLEIAAIVLAHLEHGGMLAFELDGGQQVAAAHLHTLGYGDRTFFLATQQPLCLLEYPWVADGTATNQDAVDTVALAGLDGLLGSGDIAIAEDGDVHAGVVLHLADERPVGRTLIHLGFGAAVNAEGGNAHILQPLGQLDNRFVVGIIPQTGLDGDRQVRPLDEGFGNPQHLGNVFQNATAGPFARHLAHWAAPVDVDEVRFLLLHNVKTAQQLVLVGTENLDSDGMLRGGETHLAIALLGLAVQGLGGDELGDEEVGTEVLAELPEREVGDVVHGRKTKDTIFSKFERFHL